MSTTGRIEEERKRGEKICGMIKLITIKIPAVLALLFILWMSANGVGFQAIVVIAVPGIPWVLFWNWIANIVKKD